MPFEEEMRAVFNAKFPVLRIDRSYKQARVRLFNTQFAEKL